MRRFWIHSTEAAGLCGMNGVVCTGFFPRFSSTQSICNQAACRIPENVNAHKKVRETLEKRKAQLQQGGGHSGAAVGVSSSCCDLC